MERLAERLTHYILSYEGMKEEDYNIYKYGIQTGLEMILCLFISTILAINLKSLVEFLIFIVVFFALRSYVGGFHLKHFTSCCFCSCCVICAVLIFSKKFEPSVYVSMFVTVGCMWTIYRLAPITTKKLILDDSEISYFSFKRKRIMLCIIVLDIIFGILGLGRYVSLIMYILVVILTSMIMELFNDKKCGNT